jgi:purine nucleosidase
MSTQRIIIDCDPGQDDAVALFLAMASPDELEILGITAVAGNVPLELTQRNVRLMCDIAGHGDIPVFAGCDRPMVRDLLTAEKVHGKTGIDGVEIVEPQTPLQEQHAVDYIVETLRAAEDESVTLVPTGPLTNIGTVIDRAAAAIVFGCGRPITSMGLDVTHQVLSTRARVERIRALGNPVAEATAGMLGFFERHDSKKYGVEGAPLHDPCTIAWLLDPQLFEGKFCNLSVETQSELTMGHTAIDFWHVTDRPHNVNWIYSVDADGFYDLLTDRLARFEG